MGDSFPQGVDEGRVDGLLRERKIRGSNPARDGIIPGRVIPVT